MNISSSALANLRRDYHQKLCSNILGTRKGVLNVADKSNPASVTLADGMATNMGQTLCINVPTSQRSGSAFAQYTSEFLESAFTLLQHLRPGQWKFSTKQPRIGIAAFDQYEHLEQLSILMKQFPQVKAALDNGYFIKPDIVVTRQSISDADIDINAQVIGSSEHIAKLTPLRTSNFKGSTPHRILHASISCKWSMRSDRAQNSRTEALNLIRNRKGRAPHIVAVTLEPLPSRIASIALGTGDVDCVYHAALYELYTAAQQSTYADATNLLKDMIEGRRLRDISDLPFDLAV